VGACATALCLPQAAVDPAVFDPRVALAIASAADGQALHLAHRLLAIAVAACVLLLVLRPAPGGSRAGTGRRLPALGALACILLLAPLGLATASGLLGPGGGTLHNVLAGTCLVLLAVAARPQSDRVGIDSH
jgi:heme A synthase